MKINSRPSINSKQYLNKSIYFGNTAKSFIEVVEVGVSKNCNLKCGYCPNTFLTKKTPDQIMPIPLFKKILADLKSINFQGRFTFHRYNEPLVANVEEYIGLAKEHLPNISAELFTNGTLLNAKRLEQLHNVSVDKIIVTQHTKKGFIDNLNNIPDKLLEKVDVKYGDELILINRAGNIGEIEDSLNNPCYYVQNAFVINSDGKIPLCVDDYHSQIVLGDTNKESLEEIWNKPSVTRLREELTHGNRKLLKLCANCDRTKEKRQTQDFSKNNALYRKQLLLATGSAHLQQP